MLLTKMNLAERPHHRPPNAYRVLVSAGEGLIHYMFDERRHDSSSVRTTYRRKICRLRLALMALAAAAFACAPAGRPANLLVFGDSLSAGYGIDVRQGWVALLGKRLTGSGDPAMEGWAVINASVSGETTAEGLERLPEALARAQPSVVLIELGGNDGLRGYPIEDIQGRLEKMIEQIRRAHAQPILMEIKIPDVFGPAYSRRFNQIYTDVAKSEQVPLLTFFLAPIIDDRARWFQDDSIHPNAAAQPLLLESVWSSLAPLLSKANSLPPRPRSTGMEASH